MRCAEARFGRASRERRTDGMEGKVFELCGRCAELLRGGYELRRVAGGVDNKITCAHCGKRRYGASYQMEKKSEE